VEESAVLLSALVVLSKESRLLLFAALTIGMTNLRVNYVRTRN